jgi:hypothetical protein
MRSLNPSGSVLAQVTTKLSLLAQPPSDDDSFANSTTVLIDLFLDRVFLRIQRVLLEEV